MNKILGIKLIERRGIKRGMIHRKSEPETCGSCLQRSCKSTLTGVGQRRRVARELQNKKPKTVLSIQGKGGKGDILQERTDSKGERTSNPQFAVPTFASSSSYLLVMLAAALALYWSKSSNVGVSVAEVGVVGVYKVRMPFPS
jgi:hypothetical protein